MEDNSKEDNSTRLPPLATGSIVQTQPTPAAYILEPVPKGDTMTTLRSNKDGNSGLQTLIPQPPTDPKPPSNVPMQSHKNMVVDKTENRSIAELTIHTQSAASQMEPKDKNVEQESEPQKEVQQSTITEQPSIKRKGIDQNSLGPTVEELLPPVLAKMSAEERKRWSITDSDVEQDIAVVKIVTETLINHSSSLSDHPQTYSQLIRVVVNSVMFSQCSAENRDKTVHTLLNTGWLSLLVAQLQQIFDQVGTMSDGWKNKILNSHVSNILMGFVSIGVVIKRCSAEVVQNISNDVIDLVLKLLNHADMQEAALAEDAKSPQMKIFNSLLFLLRDTALFLAKTDKQLESDTVIKIESMLCEWLGTLKSPSLCSTCERILMYLEDDQTMKRQPLASIQGVHPTDETIDEIVELAISVVKRLKSVDLETHVFKPWRFHFEFGFMVILVSTSTYKRCSAMAREKVYNAMVKDGNWYSFISSLLSRVLDVYQQKEAESLALSDYAMASALTNVYYALTTVHNGTDYCRDLEIQQLTFDLLSDVLVRQLKNPTLLDVLAEAPSDSRGSSKMLMVEIGDALLSIIHNFTFYFEACIPILREKAMTSVARKVREVAQTSDIKTSCLLIIAYLIDEGDNKDMMKITDGELSYLIEEIGKSMEEERNSGYHPEELIEGLTRIAVIDHNKLKVIDQGALPHLVKSLNAEKYSAAHQTAAARAIWNLAFTAESRQKIVDEEGCIEALNKLKDSDDKKVRNAVAGALWQIEGKQKHIENIEREGVVNNETKHIMLSYNKQARVDVLKMKDILKNNGYKVWIDVEQITAGGSTLEAMSTAIEGACLVLMFFSEAYKTSVNCRAEAEYVFEQRKPFIPIQVQPKYVPNGWLGILIGSKYRYSLIKPEIYDSEIATLLAKIAEMVTGNTTPAMDVPDAPFIAKSYAPPLLSATPSVAQPKLECSNWTSQQVIDWLDSTDLSCFKENLKNMTGEMLAELAILSQHHKDTFYSMIGHMKGVDLSDFLRFACAASKL